MKKKLLFVLTALLTSTVSAWAYDGATFKANTKEGVEMTFTILSEEAMTCQVGTRKKDWNNSAINEDTEGTITIPITANGYTVIGIGDQAFYGCSKLTNVLFESSISDPSRVASIGSSAFAECTQLTSITIPSSVTSIGGYAFGQCTGLTSINIPEGVTSISSSTFEECTSLTSINIPEGVTSIHQQAFYGCSNLKDINIPTSVNSIGADVFHSTKWYKDQPDGLLYLDNWLVGKKGSVSNDVVIENGTIGIAGSVFYKYFPISVNIPSSVTYISDDAFNDCWALGSITVDSKNTIFDSRDKCNAIIETATNTLIKGCKNTIIPSSVTCIGARAFSDCSFWESSLTIPSSVTSIGTGAFAGCFFYETLTIPSNVTSIGYGAFSNSDLENITLSEGLKSIGDGAFSSNEKLTSVTIPSSVTSFGEYVFQECSSLTSVIFKEGISQIATGTFNRCFKLTNVVIPNSVTTIGGFSFMDCESLSSLTIPSSVTNIGQDAFTGCGNLSNLRIQKKLDKAIVSYSTPYHIDFSTPIEGLKAYTVSKVDCYYDNKVTLKEISSVVETETGLILMGTPGQVYELKGSVTEGTSPTPNRLRGVNKDTEIGGYSSSYYSDYILKDGKFVKANEGILKAGKAYIDYVFGAGSREYLDINEETTEIEDPMIYGIEDLNSVEIYNLNGQHVNKPTKGLYIKNGKKIMVR